MAVITAHDPAVVQFEIAVRREAFEVIERAVIEPVALVHPCGGPREAVLREADFFSYCQREAFRAVHLKAFCLMQRQGTRAPVRVSHHHGFINGADDNGPLAARKDILVYNSEPMTEPLAIAGPVKMKLFAATDGPDTDWVVKLIDVAPNGFAFNVCEGILRARYRKGVDKPELLKAGEVYEYEVDLVGTANVFLPGHRIRVDITSSHFPQFDRNPNTGEPFGTSAKVRVAQQTVFHSAERASHILLPVVPMPKKSSIH